MSADFLFIHHWFTPFFLFWCSQYSADTNTQCWCAIKLKVSNEYGKIFSWVYFEYVVTFGLTTLFCSSSKNVQVFVIHYEVKCLKNQTWHLICQFGPAHFGNSKRHWFSSQVCWPRRLFSIIKQGIIRDFPKVSSSLILADIQIVTSDESVADWL